MDVPVTSSPQHDQNEACPIYLGIVHTRRALTVPEACAFCRQLQHKTLERWVTFVEKLLGNIAVVQYDDFLSKCRNLGLSESEGKLMYLHLTGLTI